MHVLLVGGNGFIGSHIKDSLLLCGIDVSVLDCSPERYRSPIDNVKNFLGDQADRNLAQHALAGVDAVIYLASVTIPQTSANDPVHDVVGNLVPFLRFLDLARQQKIKRFVFFSSGGTVYGPPTTLPVSEGHPSQPIVSYGIVKLMMEKYLFLLAYNDSMEVVILRVGNAYGERQDPFVQFGAIATFLGCFARGHPITIWGNGQITRDYVYVKDIAAACMAA
jgi:UDP-glucose 4-epimerase